MSEYLTAFIAVIGAGLAWLLRGWFADRKERQLTRQRDDALISGKQQEINAAASKQEAAIQQQQQKTEDAIHAADNSHIADRLDNIFK